MTTPLSLTLIMVAMGGSTKAPGIFYPFGSAAGDTDAGRSDDGSSPLIPLRRSFPYFGRTYQQIYVNHNGHLTFNQSLFQYVPNEFPENSARDIIAPFWTDLDNREKGNISYQQYTTGDVLQSATQDINTYFPNVTFTATWVFVATWDRMAYYPNTGTETTFQVVLISDSNLSFVFMNYGVIAQTERKVQIGYDTIGSTHYGSLRTCYPNNTIDIVNLHTSSNINVQGRWVFATSLHSEGFSCPNYPGLSDDVVGIRLKVSSAESLSEAEIEERILKPLGELLKKRGINVSDIRLRKIYKTEL
ncbi:sushi, nidogen and EGF-like domain-containing protein 1 [Alosa pseudoharengus]|uniref:sushi, nidogen and EGF-like domain-containing protein 1 n=1 Tax=Alosa pseudoharengus TaxID=34774 RepID=UPI003F89D755